MSEYDNEWPAVFHNLRKAQKKPSRLLWVMGWEEADDRTLGLFYSAEVQAVLLYGSEK